MTRSFATRAMTIVLSGALLALAAGCGATTFMATGTERAAGADAHIEVEHTDAQNNVITVTVENLLPPARVDASSNAFVVWMQPEGLEATRLGSLVYNERGRSGEMMATTVAGAFDLFVTAEGAHDATAPSDLVIVRASIDAPN